MRIKLDKLLLILLLMITTVGVSYAGKTTVEQRVDRHWQIYFAIDSHEIDMSLGGNGATLASVIRELNRRQNEPNKELLGVRILGYSSPDGSVAYNQTLSEKRASAIKEYLNGHLNDTIPNMDVQGRGENWEELKSLLHESSWDKAAFVISIIEDAEEADQDPELAIKSKAGWDVYRHLVQEQFPQLRSANGVETFTIQEVVNEPEQDAVAVIEEEPEPEPQPEPQPVMEEKCRCEPPVFGLSTNLLLWAALVTPNLEAEVYFGDRYSFAVAGVHRWRGYDAITKNTSVWSVTPEFRRFFRKDDKFEAHYLGLYGRYGEYDIKWKDHFRQGNNYGVGLTYGYVFDLPRWECFHIDLGGSIGWDHVKYDKYEEFDSCNAFILHSDRNIFGLTRLKASLLWRF